MGMRHEKIVKETNSLNSSFFKFTGIIKTKILLYNNMTTLQSNIYKIIRLSVS